MRSSFKEFGSVSGVTDELFHINNQIVWYNLLNSFRDNPIVINGCFKFGLKEVSQRLYQLGLISNIWDESNPCRNGNTAMVMANNAYTKSKQTGVPSAKVKLCETLWNTTKSIVLLFMTLLIF